MSGYTCVLGLVGVGKGAAAQTNRTHFLSSGCLYALALAPGLAAHWTKIVDLGQDAELLGASVSSFTVKITKASIHRVARGCSSYNCARSQQDGGR